MLRALTLITGLALMGACTQTQVYEAPESLGEFKLRVNYAFAEKARQGPVSRDATPKEHGLVHPVESFRKTPLNQKIHTFASCGHSGLTFKPRGHTAHGNRP